MADQDELDPAHRLRGILEDLRVKVLPVEVGDVVVAHLPDRYPLEGATRLMEVLGGLFPPGTRLGILSRDVELRVWRAGEPPPGLTVPHLETTELRPPPQR